MTKFGIGLFLAFLAGVFVVPITRIARSATGSPMDALLVKDYQPGSSLIVPTTEIVKARFPVIDVHAHPLAQTAAEVDDWIHTMDVVGVKVTAVLTGATGQEFDHLVDLYLKSHADRFQLYCGIDTHGFTEPGYSEAVVQELVRCYRKGARGVGEITDKGAGIEKRPPITGALLGISPSRSTLPPRDKRLHPDDERLDAFWEKCADLNLPVSLHIADHPSAWRPADAHQERTPAYQAYNQFGLDVPSYDDLLKYRDRVLEKHPRTTFIACHLSNQGNDLASLGHALDRYSNLFVDVSARDYELGREPRSAARFLDHYSDRVVFGSDMGRHQSVYQGWWRLLESADEFMPGPFWWRLYGLELSAPLLERVYNVNATKLLNWRKAAD